MSRDKPRDAGEATIDECVIEEDYGLETEEQSYDGQDTQIDPPSQECSGGETATVRIVIGT